MRYWGGLRQLVYVTYNINCNRYSKRINTVPLDYNKVKSPNSINSIYEFKHNVSPGTSQWSGNSFNIKPLIRWSNYSLEKYCQVIQVRTVMSLGTRCLREWEHKPRDWQACRIYSFIIFDYLCFRLMAVTFTDVVLHLECLHQIFKQTPLVYNIVQ